MDISPRTRDSAGADDDLAAARKHMVASQVKARGVRDERVLSALRRVPRERFVPPNHRHLAYSDAPLPIEAEQTISQPYIVAFMIEALELEGGEKALEIGAGSGYAAAILAELCAEVCAIERIEELALSAADRLAEAGYDTVTVRHADGTVGWESEAPFDAILVSAGAPMVPESLTAQLAIGGRLVVPVGASQRAQRLVRVTRQSESAFDREVLAEVRFVPLIGEEGWEDHAAAPEAVAPRVIREAPRVSNSLPNAIVRHGNTFENWKDAPLEGLLSRIGGCRVVLIGEASHGTAEFYALRARITRRLIQDHDFGIVAVEADWPDAARIDRHVRHEDARDKPTGAGDWTAFSRFPTWMWRNTDVREFVDWLHEHNRPLPCEERTAFYGLDLYSLYGSIRAVIDYLEEVDPELADVARWRYGCLSPWEADPAAYGQAALSGRYRECEHDVARMLKALLERQQEYGDRDGSRFLDAAQNASLVANAERYYRAMFYGSRASWNLRDTHMFETLNRVLAAHPEKPKAVVWAHNTHIGDASATEMSARGEHSIGQLCRQALGDHMRSIGMGTDHGSVAAASHWDGRMEIKAVRPAHRQSYEHLFHRSRAPGLLLALRDNESHDLVAKLTRPRLERAIGVIYRPESELASHYFEAERRPRTRTSRTNTLRNRTGRHPSARRA
jgi:protein-L-isoaspartate(D-aspartate) O-methyltransferase